MGKSCSFGLPRVPCVNCCQFMYLAFGFEGRIWDLIVSVPDHFLSFYFVTTTADGRTQGRTHEHGLCLISYHNDGGVIR